MQFRFLKHRSSFSHDFFVLAAAVAFLLTLTMAWIGFDTYRDYQQQRLNQMAEDAMRIDRTVGQSIKQASYLLETLSRQISQLDAAQPETIERLLRSYSTEDTVFNMFGWVNSEQQMTITSTGGALRHPRDISDRDYIKKSLIDPRKVHIGRPVEGRISGQWVLPLALGLNDAEGNYLGSVFASINIEKLTTQLRDAQRDSLTGFAVITRHFIPVAEVSKTPDFVANYFPLEILKRLNFTTALHGRIQPKKTKAGAGALAYFQCSRQFPFVYLLGTDLTQHWRLLLLQLWQRLLPVLLITVFAGLVLLVVRHRVIYPLEVLGLEAEKLLRGEPLARTVKGPIEITLLGKLLHQISAYIQERRRIEFEQKAKLAFLKRAKDTAEISNRVKVDFLTSMSHEFRTPLNTISGFIELMKNEVYGAIGNERYRQYIADIHDSVNALQLLVGDVIALSKAESAQSEAQEKPLELQLVVARSIRHLADKLKEAGVTVENRVREDLPKLRVDEARLRQIIQNLLFNALSHTPSGGSIVVEARVTEDKLHQPVFEMIITDFGAKRLPQGREDDDLLPRKSKKSLGSKQGNLGVPLTKALVAMQQATLEVESPPGKATTVTVRYPKEKIVV